MTARRGALLSSASSLCTCAPVKGGRCSDVDAPIASPKSLIASQKPSRRSACRPTTSASATCAHCDPSSPAPTSSSRRSSASSSTRTLSCVALVPAGLTTQPDLNPDEVDEIFAHPFESLCVPTRCLGPDRQPVQHAQAASFALARSRGPERPAAIPPAGACGRARRC